MGFRLKTWTNPRDGRVRIYVEGTTRDTIYFDEGAGGALAWSSKSMDTPYRYRSGDHYGKVRKDQEAASEVAKAFGFKLGETPFLDVLKRAAENPRA